MIAVYKFWHEIIRHFPKTSRYTLGGKIDSLFIELIESAYSAGYLAKTEKLPAINKAIGRLNLLNFFLQVAWEIKSLDNGKYQNLSLPLNEIGRMLGGWRNKIIKETSAQR